MRNLKPCVNGPCRGEEVALRRPALGRLGQRQGAGACRVGRGCLLLWLLIWIGAGALLSTARAETPVKILVLPFRVHALDADPELPERMAEILSGHLTRSGAVAPKAELAPGALATLIEGGEAAIGDYGRGLGADYVLWGSATWIGRQFSIDGRLLHIATGRSETLFSDGRRTEDLGAALGVLARNLSDRIFKREKIAGIRIAGNQRIETDAIQRVIHSAVGDPYDPKALADDLKAVFAMGYFEDIRLETETVPEGRQVTFAVTEKPTVRVIRIKGNQVFDDEKVQEALTLKTGSIVNVARIRNNVERIETLYKDKNYHNAKVQYQILPLDNNQADLEFTIEEGTKIRIEKIVFEGNQTVSEKQLKKVIKTSEAWIFSWLTSAGELNQEVLDQDVGQIKAYYSNNGYIQVKVADPVVQYQTGGIGITFKIDEGPRFKVGKVTVSGDLVKPAGDLTAALKIVKETYFSRETVRNDVLMLTDLYSDEGYAYAEIVPKVDQHAEDLTVDIDFALTRGPLVHFEKIIIAGNTKTRDKVIRRQLEVYEQELYSGAKLKKGVRNLYRLEYFEDVKVDTTKGATEDSMVLKVEVAEKPTGAFTFGGGYSSVEDVFMMFSVSQRNLFGRGQFLEARAHLGAVTTKYSLSFTEPWLFDIPLAGTVELYNWETDYDTYDKDGIGGGLRLSYPFWEDTRLYWGYRLDFSDITEITVDAADSVKQLAGKHTTSATEVAIRYDSRDRLFNPTQGSVHGISVEYAGLGGDVGFVKTEAETGWYFPLFWKTVGFVRAKGGVVEEVSGMLLPDYEKFYLGGINSLRGFRWRDLAPTEINSDGELSYMGGEKYVQFNAEMLFPIEEKMGVMGVVFFDTGEVFGPSESVELGRLRESVGAGIRWYSPIGPIRVEYGHILDPKPGFGEGGRWEFTMGTSF